MIERHVEIHGFSKPSFAALSVFSVAPVFPLSNMESEIAKLAYDVTFPQKQIASSSLRSPPSRQCRYHTTFGAKARRCISAYSFVSHLSNPVKRVSSKVSVINLIGISVLGHIYVCDSQISRRFPVDTGSQLSVILAKQPTVDASTAASSSKPSTPPWSPPSSTSDIRHIDCSENEVVDALFRTPIARLQPSSKIDLTGMAAEQRRVGFPCNEDVPGLQFYDLSVITGDSIILHDITASYDSFLSSALHYLATCPLVYLRCDRVCPLLKPPYDGPFRVASRGMVPFRIQHGIREEVVDLDRIKASVPDIPPDKPYGPLLPLYPSISTTFYSLTSTATNYNCSTHLQLFNHSTH
ncbi:hypothetical protein SprV_0301112400 [Sparganum proliferum]